MQHGILVLLVVACVSVTFAKGRTEQGQEEAFPDMLGTFSGLADWYEFNTTPEEGDPMSLGSDIINYKQNTRLKLTEQTGPFVRGGEWYEDNSAPGGWAFVANLYGIITHVPGTADNIYSVRLSEWLNEKEGELVDSVETIGSFHGQLQLEGATSEANSAINNNTISRVMQLALDYTGGTARRNKFGAQHMVLTKN